MVRYEIKKVFGTFGSKVALLILVAAVVYSCWSAVTDWEVQWSDENGDQQSGYSAVQNLRAARKQWAGPLDTQRLTAALQEYQRIHATPEYNSDDIQRQNIAYGWEQGVSDIRDFINSFLARSYRGFDYYRIDSISPSQLPGIYDHRVQLLKDYLETENKFSQREKEWLIDQYSALETPIYYDFFTGWQMVTQSSLFIIAFATFVLCFLTAGIFSNEFRWKADAVYYSSRRGRTSATWAKIQAAFLLSTAVYWVSILVHGLFVLGFIGFDGWNCPIQLDRWRSFYNVTFLEQYLLTIFGGYLGCLFFVALVMWVSAITKGSRLAATMPYIIFLAPNFFFQNVANPLLSRITALLPDRLLQISQRIYELDVLSIGNFITGAIPVLFVLYAILTIALIPLMYREFSRKQMA